MWLLFIYLFLIALMRTSSSMLKKSGENGQLFLAPDIQGKAFVSTIEYDVFCEPVLYGLYYVETIFFIPHLLSIF